MPDFWPLVPLRIRFPGESAVRCADHTQHGHNLTGSSRRSAGAPPPWPRTTRGERACSWLLLLAATLSAAPRPASRYVAVTDPSRPPCEWLPDDRALAAYGGPMRPAVILRRSRSSPRPWSPACTSGCRAHGRRHRDRAGTVDRATAAAATAPPTVAADHASAPDVGDAVSHHARRSTPPRPPGRRHPTHVAAGEHEFRRPSGDRHRPGPQPVDQRHGPGHRPGRLGLRERTRDA